MSATNRCPGYGAAGMSVFYELEGLLVQPDVVIVTSWPYEGEILVCARDLGKTPRLMVA
jgi:hypothetical protein